MIYKVTAGATLSCTLGSMQTKLQVPISHGSVLHGQNEATIKDHSVGVNITPFGTCAKCSPPVPCTPGFCMDWLLANEKYKIKGETALINTCILPCLSGGIVKIEESGQE